MTFTKPKQNLFWDSKRPVFFFVLSYEPHEHGQIFCSHTLYYLVEKVAAPGPVHKS